MIQRPSLLSLSAPPRSRPDVILDHVLRAVVGDARTLYFGTGIRGDSGEPRATRKSRFDVFAKDPMPHKAGFEHENKGLGLSTEPLSLVHAAGKQEHFRPLFLSGPPALVQW